jgi:ribosomal protein S18 acetylase RimI-like enzyme
MQIEPATPDDSQAVALVQVESWQHAYRDLMPAAYLASLSVSEREATWRRKLEAPSGQVLVARTAGQVVGFVAFGASRDDGAAVDCAEVWAIYVKPSFWSAGAGRLLWLGALQRVLAQGYTRVSLWVVVGNERAMRFYGRAGFVVEPQSRKQFELGGAKLEEVRFVYTPAGGLHET